MKKILYNQCLIPSVMDGTKTKTRRLIPTPKDAAHGEFPAKWKISYWAGSPFANSDDKPHWKWVDGIGQIRYVEPRYKKGEVVYVGEAWTEMIGHHRGKNDEDRYSYKIDVSPEGDEIRRDYIKCGYPYQWKSPMFMPQEAARTFLKITNVRAERICDISEEDCIAEGIKWFEPLKGFYSPHDTSVLHDTARSAFFELLRYVNKGKAVDLNQWVWDYTFELTEKPEKL